MIARCSGTVVDESGTPVSGVSIRVYEETAGWPMVQLYADEEEADTLGNPFTNNDDGTWEFYVPGGFYRISFTKDGVTVYERHVAVGTAQGYDVEDLTTIIAASIQSGLGNSATRDVGTTAGTVAAGDDSRITGAAQKASNLSDLANVITGRENLKIVVLTAAAYTALVTKDPDTLYFTT